MGSSISRVGCQKKKKKSFDKTKARLKEQPFPRQLRAPGESLGDGYLDPLIGSIGDCVSAVLEVKRRCC